MHLGCKGLSGTPKLCENVDEARYGIDARADA
jgi:hypothetical protein